MGNRKSTNTKGSDISISVTEFKSQCRSLIDEMADGKRARVVITKRNKPVAKLIPITDQAVELWGALRGTVQLEPNCDLTAPVGENWDAQHQA
jgi:prevent-host-death family protein